MNEKIDKIKIVLNNPEFNFNQKIEKIQSIVADLKESDSYASQEDRALLPRIKHIKSYVDAVKNKSVFICDESDINNHKYSEEHYLNIIAAEAKQLYER